jgi:hypothetical protein
MGLSKLEIQQMLREMNVKFHAEESYESLKNRLQKENHSLWLKSVSGKRTTDGKSEKTLVRKRKRVDSQKETGSKGPSNGSETKLEPVERSSHQTGLSSTDQSKEARVKPRVEKPMPGKPWKEVANGTQPFNRKKKVFETVLRRAGNSCEHCGLKPDAGKAPHDLKAYHLLPLDQGGEHSIKNVVALCPDCFETVANDPEPKMIKILKRKTRAKIYDSISVEKRATRRGRHRTRRNRK